MRQYTRAERHDRVRSVRGRAASCVFGCEASKYQWANLTGNYGDLDDYASMCPRCHQRYDRARLRMMDDDHHWAPAGLSARAMWMRQLAGGKAMEGGYSAIAVVLNAAFDWPDHRVIVRQQVEAWHVRRTLNKAGQAPPSPKRILRGVPRTTPKALFDPADWVQWARAGVPGPRNLGWVCPVERSEPRLPDRPLRTGLLVRPRHLSEHGRWVITNPSRKPVEM